LKIFGPLYERTLVWARHHRAPRFLVALSFVEAVIFPVPPEVMLAPMCLSQPRRGFWFASLSLAGSLVGALVGYALGHYAYELIKPLFEALGWANRISEGVNELRGMAAQSPWATFWLLSAVGFALPLKFVTWASGIVGVPILPFLASMVVGRGHRVYPLALAIRLGGERAETLLRRYIEPIGWVAMIAMLGALGWLIWHAQQGA